MQMSSQTSSPGVKQKISEGQSLIVTHYWNIPETTGEKIRFQTFFFFSLGSSFNNVSSHDLSGSVEKILWDSTKRLVKSTSFANAWRPLPSASADTSLTE